MAAVVAVQALGAVQADPVTQAEVGTLLAAAPADRLCQVISTTVAALEGADSLTITIERSPLLESEATCEIAALPGVDCLVDTEGSQIEWLELQWSVSADPLQEELARRRASIRCGDGCFRHALESALRERLVLLFEALGECVVWERDGVPEPGGASHAGPRVDAPDRAYGSIRAAVMTGWEVELVRRAAGVELALYRPPD